VFTCCCPTPLTTPGRLSGSWACRFPWPSSFQKDFALRNQSMFFFFPKRYFSDVCSLVFFAAHTSPSPISSYDQTIIHSIFFSVQATTSVVVLVFLLHLPPVWLRGNAFEKTDEDLFSPPPVVRLILPLVFLRNEVSRDAECVPPSFTPPFDDRTDLRPHWASKTLFFFGHLPARHSYPIFLFFSLPAANEPELCLTKVNPAAFYTVHLEFFNTRAKCPPSKEPRFPPVCFGAMSFTGVDSFYPSSTKLKSFIR